MESKGHQPNKGKLNINNPPKGGSGVPPTQKPGDTSRAPTEVTLSVPSPTIVTSLANQSVFSADEVDKAFQFLADYQKSSRICLTVYQGVDLMEASIKVAQVAGTTITYWIQVIMEGIEKKL